MNTGHCIKTLGTAWVLGVAFNHWVQSVSTGCCIHALDVMYELWVLYLNTKCSVLSDASRNCATHNLNLIWPGNVNFTVHCFDSPMQYFWSFLILDKILQSNYYMQQQKHKCLCWKNAIRNVNKKQNCGRGKVPFENLPQNTYMCESHETNFTVRSQSPNPQKKMDKKTKKKTS